jgi:hypothetical protein
VHLNDNIFMGTGSTTAKFYSVKGTKSEMINNEEYSSYVLYIYFRLSQERVEYERKVFTFFDLFGVLGGFYELLFIIGYFAVHSPTLKYFENRVLSRLYQVKSIEDKKILEVDRFQHISKFSTFCKNKVSAKKLVDFEEKMRKSSESVKSEGF